MPPHAMVRRFFVARICIGKKRRHPKVASVIVLVELI